MTLRNLPRPWRVALTATTLIALAGCGQSNPPVFRLNMPQIVSAEINANYEQQIANVLDAMFGTPDEPFALPATGLNAKRLKVAAGPVRSDEYGTGRGLYRQHCAHCHGINGDGAGPTAKFLNPYPRDYRPGIYKFKSTFNSARPTDADLRTVLWNGVPGTAMPSFALLPPGELDALVEYVKYLSLRGQMETALIDYVYNELDDDTDPLPLDPTADETQREVIINDLLGDIVAGWEEAADNVIVPVDENLPAPDRTPEQIAMSVQKGRELFYGKRANCFTCHGPTGLGDGQQTDYNEWNKARVKFRQETERLAEQLDSQRGELSDEAIAEMRTQLSHRRAVMSHMFHPRNAIPRNLRQGMYRGGQRPLDMFRKVYTGISGTPMPGGGPASPGAQGTLTEEEIWQIVDYVRSLPYEPASQPIHLRVNFDTLN